MRKTKPKYSAGTRVFHLPNKKWGVVSLVFESDYSDGKFYEWRYYVDYGGYRWSIAERFLDSKNPAAVPAQATPKNRL